ncbi:MAG: S41 family peptidase [Fidelibacterota bacterium]
MKSTKRKYIYTFLTVVVLGLLSLAASKSKLYQQIAQSQRLINDVYKNIIMNYADEIDVEDFTRYGIQNLLSDLDPYTVYMEAEDREGIELLTNGKYGGVGMQLGQRDGHLTVIAPMDDSPAQKAGIISGDIIIEIDGESTDDMNINEAAKKIRGEKGTKVTLTIRRFSSDTPLTFELTRSNIKIKDVTYADMIDDKTGYIRLTRFSRNSPDEMRDAFRSLLKNDPQSIIIDLRDNPGGLLRAAIDILDLMVPKGKLLLTTKGRMKDSNKTIMAKRKPIVPADVKIAILVNEGSASASEIVAGTLQDLDRAIIVGNQSFGKGLVQSVFPLDNSHSLKITTAKYFTPSGRLIQKPDYLNDEVINVDSSQIDSVFHTVGGRPVRGGGGIVPDYEAKNPLLGPLTQECYRKSLFFTFVQSHRKQYTTFSEVEQDDQLMSAFQSWLNEMDLDINIKGEKQFDEMVTAFSKRDSSDSDLQKGLLSLKAFITKEEGQLFNEEYDQLRLALLSEFAQQMENTTKRMAIRIPEDKVVMEAVRLLQEPDSYRNLLTISN